MKNDGRADLGKLVLRLALGLLILLHGIAKLRGGLDPIVGMVQAHGLPGFVAYGALVGEVLAPLMVLAGFHARIGAALVAFNSRMAGKAAPATAAPTCR
jgi:putative oxidoreductase